MLGLLTFGDLRIHAIRKHAVQLLLGALCLASPELPLATARATPSESLAIARPIWQLARQVERASFCEVMTPDTRRYLLKQADTFPSTDENARLALQNYREAIAQATAYAAADDLDETVRSERLERIFSACEQAIDRFSRLPIDETSSSCVQLSCILLMLASKEDCIGKGFSDTAIREHRQRYAERVADRLIDLREHFRNQARKTPFEFRQGIGDEEAWTDFSQQSALRLLSVAAEVTRLRLDTVALAPRGDRQFFYVAWVFPPDFESAIREGERIQVNLTGTPAQYLDQFDLKNGKVGRAESYCLQSVFTSCLGVSRQPWSQCGNDFYLAIQWKGGARFCVRFIQLDKLQGTLIFTEKDFRR